MDKDPNCLRNLSVGGPKRLIPESGLPLHWLWDVVAPSLVVFAIGFAAMFWLA